MKKTVDPTIQYLPKQSSYCGTVYAATTVFPDKCWRLHQDQNITVAKQVIYLKKIFFTTLNCVTFVNRPGLILL